MEKMLRKVTTVCSAVLILQQLFLLSACSGAISSAGESAESATGENYNSYIASTGFFACTDWAYIFCNNGQLTFLEPTLSEPIMPLCANPACDHRNASCTAHLDSANGVFADGDGLYYLNAGDADLELWRMDAEGGNRKNAGTLQVDTGSEFSYPYQIGYGTILLDLYRWKIDAQEETLLLFSLEHPEQEPAVLFQGRHSSTGVQEQNEAVADMRLWKNWALYSVCTGAGIGSGENAYTLYGYEMASGETRVLVESWASNAVAAMGENTLYWYIPGQELHVLRLDTMEDTACTVEAPAAQSCYAFLDDCFLYLIPPDGADGVMVCDLEGHLLQTLTPDIQGRTLTYGMSTPDYVFFYDFGAATCEPVCYLEKAALSAGKAEYISLERE